MKVMITDCDHDHIDIETEIFREAVIEFEMQQCKTEEDVIASCQQAEIIMNQYAPMTEKVFRHLPKLQLIVRYGVGVNNIDVDAATRYGIQVCNIPDYGVEEVADHALALMLNLSRKIMHMNASVINGNWDYRESIPIYRHRDQTVGVIGLGRIGSTFAERVHALGSRVIAYDPKYQYKRDELVLPFIEIVELDALLETADVISIHCPLEDAYHLIGREQLRKMKKTSYLINVSRGGIVDEEALAHGITQKWLAGAALDVTEIEPLDIDSPLRNSANIILTPHMAWYSEQAAYELKYKVAREVVRFKKEKLVSYPVNHVTNGRMRE